MTEYKPPKVVAKDVAYAVGRYAEAEAEDQSPEVVIHHELVMTDLLKNGGFVHRAASYNAARKWLAGMIEAFPSELGRLRLERRGVGRVWMWVWNRENKENQ